MQCPSCGWEADRRYVAEEDLPRGVDTRKAGYGTCNKCGTKMAKRIRRVSKLAQGVQLWR